MNARDTRRQLEGLLSTHGLTAAARGLLGLNQPAIRLRAHPVDLDALPVGAARLGGVPDLPEDLEWPKDAGNPLAFLGQIRLSQLGRHEGAHLLPGSGMVYFFYDATRAPKGLDPADRGSFRVLYCPNERTPLTRAKPPKGKRPAQFPAARLEYASEPTLPPEESHEAQVLTMSADEWDLYYELLQSLESSDTLGTTVRHKLVGYADPMLGDMRLDCTLIQRGLSAADDASFRVPEVAELDPKICEWQLLLQLDSDEALEMDWGGGGRLYFMIPLASLRVGRFEDCWMVQQSEWG